MNDKKRSHNLSLETQVSIFNVLICTWVELRRIKRWSDENIHFIINISIIKLLDSLISAFTYYFCSVLLLLIGHVFGIYYILCTLTRFIATSLYKRWKTKMMLSCYNMGIVISRITTTTTTFAYNKKRYSFTHLLLYLYWMCLQLAII